jgi:hypothetical protein
MPLYLNGELIEAKKFFTVQFPELEFIKLLVIIVQIIFKVGGAITP